MELTLNQLKGKHVYIYGNGYGAKIYNQVIRLLEPSIKIDYIVDNDDRYFQLENLDKDEDFYIVNSIITPKIRSIINEKIKNFALEERLIDISGIRYFLEEKVPFFHLMTEDFFNQYKKTIETNINRFNIKSQKLYRNLIEYRLLNKQKIEQLKNGWFFDKFCNHGDINQYLDFIPKNSIDVILEAGIFDGKSSVKLLNHYNANKLYGFEPFMDKFLKFKDSRMEIFPYGLWKHTCELFFVESGSSSKNVENSNTKIKAITIDSFCKDKKIDLIKMDIEGAEMPALLGGMETIKRDRPFLAISIYHSIKDFVLIPDFLMNWLLDYEFELEVYSNYLHEIILYALPKEKLN